MSILKKLVVILFLVFLSVSCGEKKSAPAAAPRNVKTPAAQAAPDKEITKTKELGSVETPQYTQAIITFISGDVYKLENGNYVYADIGDLLTEKDSIKVDTDSSCEIQFGDRAVVQVKADTELSLKTVMLKPGEAKVGLDLAVGTVICKVQKLAETEKFHVQTPSATCGVRGTEFSVKTAKGKDTVLAVKKGAVAVLPPKLDPGQLIEKAGDKGKLVAEAISKIEASAQVVTPGKEVQLTEKSYKDIQPAVKEITDSVESIAKTKGSDQEVSKDTLKILTSAVDKVTKTVETKNIPVTDISKESKGVLENTNTMHLLDIPVAAVTVKEESGNKNKTKNIQESVLYHKFSLKVIPKSARILLNKNVVGKGAYAGIFKEGTVLNFRVENKNFESKNVSFTISGKTSKEYTLSLVKSKPGPESKKEDTSAPVEVKKETAASTPVKVVKKKDTTVKEVSIDTKPAAPRQKLFAVNVGILPPDARLIVNGKPSGYGSFKGKFPEGTKLRIEGKRNGFAAQSMDVKIGPELSGEITLKLKRKPVDAVVSVSGSSLVGSITPGDNLAFTSDTKGTVSAVDPGGRVIWRVKTKNRSSVNSYPVFAHNRVYYTGASEMVIMDAKNGRVLHRQDLDKNSAHIFGRRLVSMGAYEILPANREMRILDKDSGKTIRRINLPGSGSRMTPAVWKGKILSVAQDGTLNIINSTKGIIEKSIPTGGVQPIALSITVKNDLAFFSGRKGNVVCADLKAEKVLWEKQIPGRGVQVYSDIVCSNKGAYVWSKKVLYGLGLKTGNTLFAAVRNVSSPPAVIGDSLVFGQENKKLVFMNPSNGKIQKSLNLNEVVTTRPAVLNGKIVVGTVKGKIVIVNPEGIK